LLDSLLTLYFKPDMAKDTMKAVVFKGPHKVVIEDRPIPKIKDQTDVIVKVDKVCYLLHVPTAANHPQTALCGRYAVSAS
jgi:hypothetical protein